MHRQLKALLEKATGISEFVIAANVDIRGFSSFSMRVESAEAAVFLKKVYKKLIDEYFPNASFFKPTGDGLLIIIPYAEENLKDTVTSTITTCSKVLVDFGSFCVNDPMINFDVPSRVGIGLSRGAACRLVSDGKTLDYSGRVLNLASRLMDLSRPSGIVFDTNFGMQLIPEELRKKFSEDSVYIKGIAEREPIKIYYTTDLTQISTLSKQPLEKIKWNTITDQKTLQHINEIGSSDDGSRFRYNLPTEPFDSSQIKIKVTHPTTMEYNYGFYFENFEYILEAERSVVFVEFDTLAKRLESNGVKDDWEVTIEIMYPEK